MWILREMSPLMQVSCLWKTKAWARHFILSKQTTGLSFSGCSDAFQAVCSLNRWDASTEQTIARRPGRRCELPFPWLTLEGGVVLGRQQPEGPLSHTLQCVVLTGIPILEANTTVSAEASSIVNPLWKEGGGVKRQSSLCCLGRWWWRHSLTRVNHNRTFTSSHMFTHHTNKKTNKIQSRLSLKMSQTPTNYTHKLHTLFLWGPFQVLVCFGVASCLRDKILNSYPVFLSDFRPVGSLEEKIVNTFVRAQKHTKHTKKLIVWDEREHGLHTYKKEEI